MTLSLDELHTAVVSLLAAYLADPEDGKRPSLLRDAAALIIQAREHHFTTNDGNPDLAGRSYAYRTWMGQVYGETTQNQQTKTRLANLMHYHLGNALRDAHPAETLTDLGLHLNSTRERGITRRSKRSDLVSLVRPGKPYTADETRQAIGYILTMLRRAENAPLSPQERAEVLPDLDEVKRLTEALRGAL